MSVVFVERLPLISTWTIVDWMATASYNNIQMDGTRQYCVIDEHMHTVVVDRDNVSNTVLIHWVSAVASLRSEIYAPGFEPAY